MAKARGKATEKGRTKAPRPKATRARRPGRRQRLIVEAQGRRLEEAFLNDRALQRDMEAEAADASDPEALVTPEMIEQLREGLAARRQVVAPAPSGPESLTRGPTLPDEGPGWRILEAVERREAAGGEAEAARQVRPVEEAAGLEFFAAPRALFSTDQVVVVPGFLASSLSDTAPGGLGLVWIDPLLSFRDELGALQLAPYDGNERDLDGRVRIASLGTLPYLYDVLRLSLEVRRYTVELFPVDWRRDLDIAAGLLAARLRALAGESRRPIHVIAHSQGALVARRALQLLGRHEARWIVRHLVLLGPANFGSFSAAFALAGNHSLLPLVRRFAYEPARGFQAVLASMTGVYQLLPFDAGRTPWLAGNDYSRPAFWRQPIDEVRLARFFGWAGSIDSRFQDDRTAVILGDNYGRPTTGGVAYRGALLEDLPGSNLPGDGTVTHANAVLPGVRTYLARDAEHSMLATYRHVISAVLDVLADRAVGLEEVPSDPAAHLIPMPAPSRGLAAPAVRARRGRPEAGVTQAGASRRATSEAGRKRAKRGGESS